MLVQHGVRHLLLADDRERNGPLHTIPLLNAYHPFPSLPPATAATAVDPTPVRVKISVAAGQIVSIGSLDRSIRLHNIQLTTTASATSTSGERNADRIWFDIAHLDLSPKTFQPSESSTQTDSANTYRDDGSANVALSNLEQSAVPQPARRFQLPFFRNGNVYERTLIRQLIRHDDHVTVYGDASNPLHEDTANKILESNLSSVLDFVSQKIGPITDLDGDDRLALVLGQLSDPIPADVSQEPIRGCVRPADFQIGWVNSVDAVYLAPSQLDIPELNSLLAHEFAHAATFSLLVKSGQAPTAMPSWLNEAIAHHIEQQLTPESNNLQRRQRLYRAAPWNYPSVIPDSFAGMKLRRGPSRVASLELLQASFKDNADQDLKELIQSRGDGIDRLQIIRQKDFPSLFRSFAQHMVAQSITTQTDQFLPDSTKHEPDAPSPRAAFVLSKSLNQSIQIRGTAVAISSPAEADCELEILTTRDAIPQITIFGPSKPSQQRTPVAVD